MLGRDPRAAPEGSACPAACGEAGIAEDALRKLAELAFEDVCHLENPRPCTREDLQKLYVASF